MPGQNRIVIGVDEAGYGTNIGPLVVAATAWRIPGDMTEIEFQDSLAETFQPRAWCEGCDYVPLGDSKVLYSSQAGLGSLEAGLLAMLGTAIPIEDCFSQFVRRVIDAGRWSGFHSGLKPWHLPLQDPLPIAMTKDEIARLNRIALGALARNHAQFLETRIIVATEELFNSAVDRLGSKGRLLSDETLYLVRRMIEHYDGEPIEVFCDRQGGRKRYVPVLLDAMPDEWFDTIAESPVRSTYRRCRVPDCQIHFTVRGDSFPPTALASMAAKYFRERFMKIINSFWIERIPDLRPTAGYPLDARRFRAAIEPQALALGHSASEWWRMC